VSSLILTTTARLLVALMMLFSVFILLRGHNEPGGGFLGGLIAATSFVLYTLAEGPGSVRAALRFDPRGIALVGLGLAVAAGVAGLLADEPFLTGLWTRVLGAKVGTPLLFDVGVYLVVVGSVVGLVLGLEEEG
jgi:multisubunit Na+/H+ antiporter MnhB subunit